MGLKHKRGRCVLGVAVASVLLALCPSAMALDPALDVSQYAHTAWKIREGFAQGVIYAIAQTPDGYLWLGTEFGLLRFDGVRTVQWQPPEGQHLPASTIQCLLVGRDGTLWIGTWKGLASWKDGKFVQYPELAGLLIMGLVEDRDGMVWAAGFAYNPPGKLCAIRNGKVHCYGEDGALGKGPVGLYQDSKSTLWAGVFDGLWRWQPGPPKFYPIAGESVGVQGLAESDDGTLLASLRGRVAEFAQGKFKAAYPYPGAARLLIARKLLRDRDGSLWVGTAGFGLVHVHRGTTDTFTQRDGLSGDTISALFQDREGNIWVATNRGLDRFRDFSVVTFSEKQGFSFALGVGSVMAARDGSVWQSTANGLQRWNNGQITLYREPNAKPAQSLSRLGGKLREVTLSGFPEHQFMSLFEDDHRRIWVATAGGVGYIQNDRFTPISAAPGGIPWSSTGDSKGNLWISYWERGFLHLLGDNLVQRIPWAELGSNDIASALAADPVRGGVWLGYSKGGLSYFANGQIRQTYTAADGLGEGRVSDLRFDHEGNLWAATQGGLSRLKDGRIATLTTKNGLPCDGSHWAIEDDDSFWLYLYCGLFRIARSELHAWGADPKWRIQGTLFDSSDGVSNLGDEPTVGPGVAKTPDGRIWFMTTEGTSLIDPHHLLSNKLPPPVRVEQITADRKTYEAGETSIGHVHLPARIRDLEIDYTALSLVVPEKVRFRCKLEGWDRDWQEVGNRRQAFYSNLPPRHYRFRVMACNNSGVWNEAGAFLDFSIAAAYYQSWWFRLSCVAAFLGLLWMIYDLRLRQVADKVRHRMQGRLEERERIARDLHDTFLQSVQGLVLKFAAVAKQIPSEEPARRSMEDALDQADSVLAEGRDRVRNLRTARIGFGELPMAFQVVAEQTASGRGTSFKTVVEGSIRELHPLIREEAYAIGREAIINALTHSEGLHVEAEIIYDSRHFRLRVRDDGRGIEPGILEKGGRHNHWGLQGMRERGRRIGGKLELWSRPGAGTEVEFTIPAATAYRSGGTRSKMLWFRRSSSTGSEPV
jgi:signal transduction histidine kinase/ligand-binding sensor domain-containing protein